MRWWLLSAMMAGVLCGCAAGSQGYQLESPEQYAHFSVEDDFLAIYWNIIRQDGQVVAEGYLEYVGGPGNVVKWVNVMLYGLDGEGRVISKATGVPHRDTFMVGDQGLFRIPMPVTGQEQDFVVRARYWWEPFDMGGGKRGR